MLQFLIANVRKRHRVPVIRSLPSEHTFSPRFPVQRSRRGVDFRRRRFDRARLSKLIGQRLRLGGEGSCRA